jgi:hypothetical protein
MHDHSIDALFDQFRAGGPLMVPQDRPRPVRSAAVAVEPAPPSPPPPWPCSSPCR